MRNGCLAALAALLTSGLASAQHFGDSPAANLWEPSAIGGQTSPSGSASGTALPAAIADAQARTFAVWGSGEYLMWWFRGGRVPPLVTGGGNGVIGSPGTRVLVGSLNFDNDFRQGGRFALGYQFERNPLIGVESNYFFLGDRQSSAGFASTGTPVLGQPFVNAVTGLPDANLVAFPAVAVGSVAVVSRTWLWGAEANLTADLMSSDTFHLTALGGFRFLSLDDQVTAGERFRVAPNVPGFGGNSVTLQDEFRTANRFYGGQLGLEAGVRFGLLTLDVRGKLGLGQMQQVAHVNGVTTVLSPAGTTTIFQGGQYALRSNIGRYQRDELAFIPEVGVNAGVQLTRHTRLSVGYLFLWVSTVARAGDQIDPVVNVSQFPIRSGNGPLVGPARPAFNFQATDFWAQGLSFGLELRY